MRAHFFTASALVVTLGLSTLLARRLHDHGLWSGLSPVVLAAQATTNTKSNYDLTQVRVVNDVLKKVRDRYVDPKRVRPREMLLAALNAVQRDVAQVIVSHDEGSNEVLVRVDTQEKKFSIANVDGLWDVSARLREVFAFLQEGLKNADVDLREVEYAACNGMLRTLDPHSVLLSPDAYKEMRVSTSGQFGGVGMIISLRDQQLTVINPMPGAPAVRAGIHRNDRIVKIDNESTLNMGTNEAANHLRGVPGTKVTVWIHRDGPDGWTGVKPFELSREVIRVASVEHRLLDGNIGYVRLKQFQQNTTTDMRAALRSMKKNGELRGLVLDLRGNPGGLLDQAARVADTFISSGLLVATVGNPSEGREEKVAHEEDTEPNYPLAVLVSGSSASASEIVAGTLKNHERGVIIGETTFGKGSVQLILDDVPDKAALKLTIAQYLTEPGDISIQGVGVTPDVQLDPMTADPLEMDLTVDAGMLKERDLSRSLANARAREGQKPGETVRYNLPIRERIELREHGGDPDENFALDFPIRFARDFVSKIQPGKRTEQVRSAKGYITDTRKMELDKVADELKALGIDWSDAPVDMPTQPADVEVAFETNRPNNEVTAGESMNLKLTVKNVSTTPLYRFYATTKSDNPLFDNKELVVGKLEPGKSKTVAIPVGWCEIKGHKFGSLSPLPKDLARTCVVPKDTLTRADGIKLKFDEAKSRVSKDADLRVTIRALERPTFAYSYQVVDNNPKKGNGDGRAQVGEFFTLFVTVKNTGRARSFETQANVRNLSGDAVLLHDGRHDLSNLQPGEIKKIAFTFEVNGGKQAQADGAVRLELSIADRDLREVATEKIRVPLLSPATFRAMGGARQAKATGAELLSAPDAAARPFGRLLAGTAATALAESNGFIKLALGSGRFGFVRATELDAGGTPASEVAFEDTMAHAPPALEVAPPTLATRDGQLTISGTASDDAKLLDLFVFVGSKKVFYRSNRNGSDPRKLTFSSSIPLRAGTNVVTVVARENPDTTTRRAFIIRRDGQNGELLATPKTDDDSLEATSGDDD